MSEASTSEQPRAAEPLPTVPVAAGFTGWYTVVMTALVAIMSQIDRGVLALFVQPMKRDFHLSDTQVSFLLGAAFTLFYVVGGPPISRMADRGIRKRVISGCLAVWSMATALCGFAQGYWGFFASRAVIGAAEAGCGPASLSMIGDAIPRQKLPRAYAIYNSGFLGGGALSMVIGGVLLGALAHIPPTHIAGIGTVFYWQWVFVILGVPGLLIALLFLLTVREPARKGAVQAGGYSMKEVLAYVVSQRAMHWPLIASVLCMGFQTYGLIAWMPAFYERTYGWGPEKVGPLLGTITLVTGTIGLFAGARLAQFLPIPLFVAAPLMPDPWWALGLNAAGGLFATMGAAGYNAAINLSTPNAMRSQINVMYFILQNAIAGSFGPTLVALFTDYVAQSENDLRYVIAGFRLVLGPLTAFALYKALAPYAQVYRQRVEEGV